MMRWILVLYSILKIVYCARYQVVGPEDQTKLIQLKSQYNIEPGGFTSLQVDVPTEHLSVYGKMPPKLKSITTENEDGIYGNGDVIVLNLKFTAEVNVSGYPSLTMNTGCHNDDCFAPEIQSFRCASDFGSFAIRLGDQYIMSIDSNTTQDQLKYKLEELMGVHEVTVKYSNSKSENTMRNELCTADGNTVTITFERFSFPQYDGDIPELQLDRLNWYDDPRSMLSQGNVEDRLKGIHAAYTVELSEVAIEVQKGRQQRDGVAYYFSGDGTKDLTFQYTVRDGDLIDDLNVVSFDFIEGYVYSPLTGDNVSTAVPAFGQAFRYMDSSPASLGSGSDIAITSVQAKVLYVTSPDPNNIYTWGDVITIYAYFDLPIKYYGSGIHILLKPGQLFRKAYVHSLLADRRTLVFKYWIAAGDVASDLDYLSSSALVLEGGGIFRFSSSNSSAAIITLPAPTAPNSLSYLKDIVVDTSSPLVLDFELHYPTSGNYTAGDEVDLLLRYDYRVSVVGTPVIWVRNNIRQHNNARIRTAPLGQSVVYGQASPGDVSAISMQFEFNWDLYDGDRVEVYLPHFRGDVDMDLYLFEGDIYGTSFRARWNSNTNILDLQLIDGMIPAFTPVSLTVQSRSGIIVSDQGVVATANAVKYTVTSQLFNISEQTFASIGAVMFSTLSLQISPYVSGGSVVVQFDFVVPQRIVIGDTFSLYMPGFVLASTSPSVSTAHPVFDMSWSANSSTLEFETTAAVEDLLFSIRINDFMAFTSPAGGVGADTITLTAQTTFNGNVYGISIPSVTHLCSDPLASVEYLTKTPGAISAVAFEWTVGLDALAVDDLVIFTLPVDGSITSTTTRDVSTHVINADGSESVWRASITGRVVTFAATAFVSSGSTIRLTIAAAGGIIVPANGVRPGVDTFSIKVVSANCQMGSAKVTPFKFFVIRVTNAVVAYTSNIVSDSRVGIQFNFTTTQRLGIGDVITLSLPAFDRPGEADVFDTGVTSSVPVTARYNRIRMWMEFTLTAAYTPVSGRAFSIMIPSSPGFYLPYTGIKSNDGSITMAIRSESNGYVEDIVVSNECVGFCTVTTTIDTSILNEPLEVTLGLVFSAAIPINADINVGFVGIDATDGWASIKFGSFSPVFTALGASSATVTTGISIPAKAAFTLSLVGLNVTSTTASMTLTAYDSAARNNGPVSVTVPLTGFVANPGITTTVLDFEETSSADGISYSAGISFVVSNGMSAGNALLVSLPDFDLSDAELMFQNETNFTISFDTTSDILRITTLEDVPSSTAVVLHIGNIVLPYIGVPPSYYFFADVNMGGSDAKPTYALDLGGSVVSAYKDFDTLGTVRVIRDATVQFENDGVNSYLKLGVWVNFDVVAGTAFDFVIPGFPDLNQTFYVHSTNFFSMGVFNSTFHFTVDNVVGVNRGGLDMYIFNNESSFFTLPAAGFNDATVSSIEIALPTLAAVQSAVDVTCIGICVAKLSPTVSKSGYATDYSLAVTLSDRINNGDVISMTLVGFESVGDSTFILACTPSSIGVSATWNETLKELSLIFTENRTSVTSFTVSISRNALIKLPIDGVRADDNMFDMRWQSSALDLISGPLLTVKPVSTLIEAFMELTPHRPEEPVNMSLSFMISNPLTVGDIVIVTLPSYTVSTGPMAVHGASSASFSLQAFAATGTTAMASLKFTCLESVSAEAPLHLEVYGIVTPMDGVHAGSRRSTLSVVSTADAAMSTQRIVNYTAIGSLAESFIAVSAGRTVDIKTIRIEFVVYCSPVVGDEITISLPALQGSDHAVTILYGNDTVSGFWYETTSKLVLTVVEDMPLGRLNFTIQSDQLDYTKDIYYANDADFTFMVSSDLCPVDVSSFVTSDPIGLAASSVGFGNPVAGGVSSLTFSFTIVDRLAPGDMISLNLTGFSRTLNSSLVVSGSGVPYFGDISYAQYDDLGAIYFPVGANVSAMTTLTFVIAASNEIYISPSGVDPVGSVALSLSHRSDDFLEMAGFVQQVQSVGYFVSKSVSIDNRLPGADSKISLTFALSGDMLPSEYVSVKLPGFRLRSGSNVASSLPLSGPFMSRFGASWLPSSKTLTFTAFSLIPGGTLVTVEIPSGYLLTPDNGVAVSESETFVISSTAASAPVASTPLDDISTIPSMMRASISFAASDFEDASVVPSLEGLYNKSILLYPGHDLNQDDVGATVTIGGVLYTIQALDGDILTFEELYSGDLIDLGIPSTYLYTPDARPAYYLSGSGTTELLFRYRVRRGDESIGMKVHSTTSSSHITEPLALPTPTDQLLRYSTVPSVPLNRVLPLTIDYGGAINLDSTRPTIIQISSTSAAGTYTVGDLIDVQIQFSHRVLVNAAITNAPAILLQKPTGEIAVARYIHGSGSDTLTFAYTVQEGDMVFRSNQLIRFNDSSSNVIQPLRVIMANQFDYIRRFARYPTIDVVVDIPESAVNINPNISWVGDGVYVTSLSATPGEINEDNTYTAGDVLYLYVTFSGPVFISVTNSVSPLSEQVTIELDMGRASGVPGVAKYDNTTSSNTTLRFIYTITDEDYIPSGGLHLHCTCKDFFNRTLIQLADGATVVEIDRNLPASVLLSRDSAISSLSILNSLIVVTNSPVIKRLSANVTTSVHSPGVSIAISVHFDLRVSVIGFVRLMMSGDNNTECTAHFYGGNNTNTLQFLYVPSVASSTAVVSCRYVNGLDTSIGKVFRYSQRPTIVATSTLPVPGSILSIGVTRKISIDGTPVYPVRATVNVPEDQVIVPLSSLNLRSTTDEIIKVVYLYNQEYDAVRIEYNATHGSVLDYVQQYVNEPLSLVDLFVDTKYYGYLVSNAANSPLLFAPEVATSSAALELFYENDQWWSHYLASGVLEIGVHYDRRVVTSGVYIPLDIGSSLNNAFAHTESRVWYLTLDMTDLSPHEENDISQHQFQLRYGGYTTQCIAVGGSLQGVMSLHAKLDDIAPLKRLGISVQRIQDDGNKKVFVISSKRPATHALNVAPSFAACMKPLRANRVTIESEGTLNLRYIVQSRNAIVLRPNGTVSAGVYEIALPRDAGMYVSKFGVEKGGLSVEHTNRLGFKISQRSSEFVSIPHKALSSLIFDSSSLPGEPSDVHCSICLGISMRPGDRIIVSLPGFTSVDDLVGSFVGYDLVWNVSLAIMEIVMTSPLNSYQCAEVEILGTDIGLFLPTRAVLDRQAFGFSFEGANGTVDWAVFDFVSENVISKFAVIVENPIPRNFSAVTVNFTSTVELESSSTLIVHMPEYRLARSQWLLDEETNVQIAPLSLAGPFSHAFTATWLNTSAIKLVALFNLRPGDYNIEVTADSRIIVATPAQNQTLSPPSFEVVSTNWTLHDSPVLDFTQVIGIVSSSLNITLDRQNGNSMTSLMFTAGFSYDIKGPVNITLRVPSLSHSLRQWRSTIDSQTEVSWSELHKSFHIVSGRSLFNESGFSLHLDAENLTHFTMGTQGIPIQGSTSDDVQVAISNVRSYLPFIPVHNVRIVPMITHSYLEFVGDYFSEEPSEIIVRISLNVPVGSDDYFAVHLPGSHDVYHNNDVTLSGSSASFALMQYDSSTSMLTFNITEAPAGVMELEWIVPVTARIYRPTVVSQYGSKIYTISWSNSYENTGNVFIDEIQAGPFLSSAIAFSSPQASAPSDMTLKVITTVDLRKGDKIRIALDGFTFSWSTYTVADENGNLWLSKWSSDILTLEATRSFPVASFEFQFRGSKAPVLPPAGSDIPTISLTRGTSTLSPEAVVKVQPIGGLHANTSIVIHIHDYQSDASPVTDIFVNLIMKSALNKGDEVILHLPQFTFLFDSSVEVRGYNASDPDAALGASSVFAAKTIADDRNIVVTMLTGGVDSIMATFRSTDGVLIAGWSSCSSIDSSCPVTISTVSEACPISAVDVYADYLMKFADSSIQLSTTTHGIPGITFVPTRLPTTMPPTSTVGSDPSSMPTGEPSAQPSETPTGRPSNPGYTLPENVLIDLTLTVQTLLLQGTVISVHLPQLNAAAALTSSDIEIIATTSHQNLNTLFSPSFDEVNKVLSLELLVDLPASGTGSGLNLQFTVISQQLTINNVIIYENDASITYDIKYNGRSVNNVRFDRVVPVGLSTASLTMSDVYAGGITELALSISPPAAGFSSGTNVSVVLPGFSTSVTNVAYTLALDSCADVKGVRWHSSSESLIVSFSGLCLNGLKMIVTGANEFRSSADGINAIVTLPTIIVRNEEIDLGPSALKSFTPTVGLTSTRVSFNTSVLSGMPTLVIASFNSVGLFKIDDHVDIYLPMFWTAQYDIITYSCNDLVTESLVYAAEWIACSDTLRIKFINASSESSHCVAVSGIRLPRVGVSVQLADIISFSGSSSSGVIHSAVAEYVQLVGHVLHSAVTYTYVSLLSDTGCRLEFTLDNVLRVGEQVRFKLPGFVVSGGVNVFTADDSVDGRFSAAWNPADYSLTIITATQIERGTSIVIFVGDTSIYDGFTLPPAGVTIEDAKKFVLSTVAEDGNVIDCEVEDVQKVGFEVAEVNYEVFDLSNPVAVAIHFRFAQSLSVGDVITIIAPCLEGDNTNTLSVMGGQGVTHFESIAAVSFDSNTKALELLVTTAVEAFVDIDIHIGVENELYIGPQGTWNQTHSISCATASIGTLASRDILHTPSNIVGVMVLDPSLVCSLDSGNYQERCRLELKIDIKEDLGADDSIVLSQRGWELDSLSSDYNNLVLEGSGAYNFLAQWRPADDSDQVRIAAKEVSILPSGYLLADEDYDYHTVETFTPILPSHVSIISTLPRIAAVTVSNSLGMLVCGDSVVIDVTFTEVVSFAASIPTPLSLPDVRLLLNTNEYAYYVSGNATKTLHFLYHVTSPVDVIDLSPLGPNALEFGETIIHRLGSPRVVANITVPEPYGVMRREVPVHELSVQCAGSVVVEDVNLCDKPESLHPQFIQPGDIIDVCVQFERGVELSLGSDLSLLLSGSAVASDGTAIALRASYVNVSAEQWLVVDGREGSFVVSHNDEMTSCVSWSDVNGLQRALEGLESLKDSLPLIINRYAHANGMSYQLLFDGVAPFVLEVVRYQCDYEPLPSTRIELPPNKLRTLTFRRQIQTSDTFDNNRLAVNSTNSLVTHAGGVYVATTTQWRTLADTSLPVTPDTNSLEVQAASTIMFTEEPLMVRVTSNFSTTAVTGDIVEIEVVYPTPVVVFGYPYLEVEVFNLLVNATVSRNAVYGLHIDESGAVSRTVVFSYVVQHGDTAFPLVETSTHALKLNASQILLASRYPTRAINTSLPAAYDHRLNTSNVLVDATSPPRLYDVSTNVPAGDYGAGQDIEVSLTFYSTVFIGNISDRSDAFILLNTTASGRKMFYLSGNGTNTLTFLYSVQSGDFSTALSFFAEGSYCLLLGGRAVFSDTLNNTWTSIDDCSFESTLELISIDTSTPEVVRVNSTNPDGDYYSGQLVDIFVEFNKPVFILSDNAAAPLLELFIPHQVPNIFASYSYGNGTKEIHFRYVIPAPPTRIFQHPRIRLDYAGTASLYQHLRGTVFKRVATRPTTEANVFLPTEDISYVRIDRDILLWFELPSITSTIAVNSSGTYTSGDFIVIEVSFTQPVMTFIPPVLRLNTGAVHRNALYLCGNNSKVFTFGYTVQDGDSSSRLDYVDTRKPPYNTKMDVSFALRTDVVKGASGRLMADVMGADGRADDIVLYRDDLWGQIFRESDVAFVRAVVDLPLPGAPGSLSVTSNIKIDTTPPNITKIYTTVPDGSYGPKVDIPVFVRFNQEVVVEGKPRVLFFVSRIDRYAPLTGGDGSNELSFVYSVTYVDDMALFDYKHTHSLEFPVHVNSSGYDVLGGTIKRKSQKPSIDANMTLAWVTYVESVISSTSISGSGHSIRLSGIAKAIPEEISVVAEKRVYSIGDVLHIEVKFADIMTFLDNETYIVLNSKTHAYFAYQVDAFTAVFELTIQLGDEVDSLTYPDIFSMRTSTSCSIRDETTGVCAAQNLPMPTSTANNGKDELTPKAVKISQRSVEISGLGIVKPSYGALIVEPVKDVATMQGLCDSAGESWFFSEQIDNNAGIRIITTTTCPNHFSTCQQENCEGTESRGAVKLTTVTVPLYPGFSATPISTLCTTGPVGIAMNGVDIYGPSDGNEECGDAVNIEGVTFDKCGGHANEDGRYHYHSTPVCLLSQLGNSVASHSPQIGWALDGFPVYGNYGPSGNLMLPCHLAGADPTYCLDECNGFFGEIDGVDSYTYRYYMSGESPTGECSDSVKYSGRCSRTNDPCCISAVPQSALYPYSIGCFKGCPIANTTCETSTSQLGYTSTFTPSLSRSPTRTYDGTKLTVQSEVDMRQAEAMASLARPDNFLPYDIKRVTTLVAVPSGADVTTGDKIQITIAFSETVLVQGTPLLVLYIDGVSPLYLPYSGHLDESTILFDYIVDKTAAGSDIWCTTNSHIDLNGGMILHKTNFLPVRSADLELGHICCEDECTYSMHVRDTSPVVVRVFSSQNGTFAAPDELELFVEFSGPVAVVGTPLLELKLPGSPTAEFVGLESSQVLKFKYVIASTDTTSSLDTVSTASFLFKNKQFYDGIFMDDVYARLPVNVTLPHPGEIGSLGRSNTIVIDLTRVKNTAITINPVTSTAGDILTVSFVFNRDITVVDYSLTSLFIDIPDPMFIRFNITAYESDTPSERIAFYSSYSDNKLYFIYPVTASDPSGVVSVSDVTPIALGDFGITDKETGVLTGMGVDTSILDTELGTIDNDVPYVVGVSSPNISLAYPWGIGDVVNIIVEMNSPVAVLQTPTLRLALDNGVSYATFVIDQNATVYLNGFECYTQLTFVYTIAPGDSAYPLEYDGTTALEGDLRRCVESAPPTIPADLTLPLPFSEGSVGFCCPMNIDSAPPFVEYVMPLKKAGVYGMNELIVIQVRFSKPVIVFGNPVLSMYAGPGNATYAYYNESFRERDVLVNIKDTDVLFFYTVNQHDDAEDLHHFGVDSIMLPNNASILHRTQTPVTAADVSLREPDDHELLFDKVQRQWKFGYPSKVEVLIRDFYHTDPSQLLVRLEHKSRAVDLFDSCCSNGGKFGRSVPGSRLGNNVTVLDVDTGIGSDLFFSDTRAENIALLGVANQSSTDFGGVASRAIDGSSSPVYGDRSTTETSSSDYDGWWQLHLPAGSSVTSINIWPRTPQLWIPAVVSVTIKAFDAFPRGRFKLELPGIQGSDPSEQTVKTGFINMGASAQEVQNRLTSIGSLAQLRVYRETVVGDGVEKGHGWKYLITFNGVEIPEPQVNIVEQTFIGGVDVIDGQAQENILKFQLVTYSLVEKRGFAKPVNRVANFVGGVDGMNSWLIPFWVMIFLEDGTQPPIGLNESIAKAAWLGRYDRIDKVKQIVLTTKLENVGYVKIQREGGGALALAEVEVFEETLNSLLWYTEGYPITAAPVIRPYQAVDSFENAFNNVKFTDRWSLQITSSPSFTPGNIQGWDGSYGTVSDWVLVVTDLAGVVHTYYQDLRAEIKSLPKYGTLIATTTYSRHSYGEWKQAFELTEDGVIDASSDMKRALGICNGVDTTGMNGVRSGVDGYRYCVDNFGVGPPLNNRRDGDYAIQRFLRNERVLYYVPRLHYRGPDYFTYVIHDGPVIQREAEGASEVTIHIRKCRDSQSRRIAAGIHSLCSCQASEDAVIDDWITCRSKVSTVCAEKGYRNDFLNLCLSCAGDLADDLYMVPMKCVSEVIRAVSYLTAGRRCDTEPSYSCQDEINTEPGRENYNYLSLMSYPWNNPMSTSRDYSGDP